MGLSRFHFCYLDPFRPIFRIFQKVFCYSFFLTLQVPQHSKQCSKQVDPSPISLIPFTKLSVLIMSHKIFKSFSGSTTVQGFKLGFLYCQAQPKPQFNWAELALVLISPATRPAGRPAGRPPTQTCSEKI